MVRHVSPGDIFSIAMRRPDYRATAIAVVDSLTLVWSSDDWKAFIARSFALALNALRTVGQRLKDADARVRGLSTKEIERRVRPVLLRLVQQAARRSEEGILIDFPSPG